MQVLADERLVHETAFPGGAPIVPGEVAPGLDLDAEGLEVAGRHCVEEAPRVLPVPGLDARDGDAAVPATARQEAGAVRSHGLDAGYGREALDQRAEDLPLARLVVDGRGLHPERHHPLRLEAEVHAAQVLQRADEETCAHQQHGREPDLQAHERLAQADVTLTARDAAGFALERDPRGDARSLNCWCEPEEERRHDRDARGEQQHPQVGCRPEREVGRVEGQEANQRHAEPEADHEPGGSSEDREHQALQQELADDARAGGAQGHADGDLLLARGGAREQQARDVRARDQQHECDEPLQDEERLLETLPQVGHAAGGRDQRKSLLQEALPLVRELPEQRPLQLFVLALPVQHAHRSLRLAAGDTGFQAAEQVEPGVALVVELVPGRRDDGLHHHRHPHVGGYPAVGPFEARIRDAYDRERRAVQADRPADEVLRFGEAVTPEVVLQDDDGMGVLVPVVVRVQHAAEVGPDTEDVEEIAGHEPDADSLAAVVADEARRLDELSGEPGEDRVAVPQREIEGMRERVHAVPGLGADAAAFEPELDELAGFAHGQKPQQDLVRQAEDRAVGADSEG